MLEGTPLAETKRSKMMRKVAHLRFWEDVSCDRAELTTDHWYRDAWHVTRDTWRVTRDAWAAVPWRDAVTHRWLPHRAHEDAANLNEHHLKEIKNLAGQVIGDRDQKNSWNYRRVKRCYTTHHHHPPHHTTSVQARWHWEYWMCKG